MTKIISVIIVNYNAGTVLTDCVKNVLASTCPVEVFISDNHSTDGSIAYLKKHYGSHPALHIQENNENLGFSKGNNIVFPKTSGDTILFLNPDCLIQPDTLEKMVTIMEEYPEVGMAGPLIQLLDGREQLGCRGLTPTPWRTMMSLLKLDRLFPNNPKLQGYLLNRQPLPDKPMFVELISGAFMFVKRKAIQEVGLLDENYFLYCEDNDWFHRFLEKDWKILFVPSVVLTHLKGICGKNMPLKILAYKRDSMIRYYNKFFKEKYSKIVSLLVKATIWIRFLLLTIFFSIKKLNIR